MGFFDFVDDVADKVKQGAEWVEDAAGKVKQGAEWVEDTARKLGLGKIADVAKSVGKFAGKFAIAPTPILQGGQKLIEEMRKSAGDGKPERGESFWDSSRKFKDQFELLGHAHPGSDWDGGSASKAYNDRTIEQENRVSTLAQADSDLAGIVSDEADQIYQFRGTLDYWHQWLADFGSYSQYVGAAGPAGKALQWELRRGQFRWLCRTAYRRHGPCTTTGRTTRTR